ncbi:MULTISPECIES: LysR family transcriptional regulator [unclassified Chelatococcus]|uniref:LysR family transcriptional regulator n=1 Tax=unclassified Chelatococcus TaxID=2638111 RepID=UPI001BCD6FA2|nr:MULTISPECIES: LysR family transcriptional regulator [unclassified Chelatococcus]MBS7695886.1 LysR family transcriptional regulator [Chelatococcus sp. YT9]MBX3555739.1 LysR family transcriptional regulator [Chelatococcus sp.]
MKLANFETFVLLSRLRHFGRTADQLHTTQPAISSRIAALEQELGVRLIEREGRKFHLTPAGHAALPVIEKLLADYERLKAGFADPDQFAVTLRIGAIDAIVQTWLPSFYQKLRDAFPRAQIDIIVDTTTNLLSGMRDGEIDLNFCLDPVLEEGYRSFVVCTYSMSWVASPKLAQPGRVYSVAELGAMPLITFQRHTPPYRTIAPYFQDESVLASQLSFSNSLPAMIRLAIDGFGVAAVPTLCVARDIEAGLLVDMDVVKPLPPMQFIANYHPAPGSVLIERVVSLAKETVSEFCSSIDPTKAWA